MDKITEVSLLLDFYGNLLTSRQYEILELHYNNDYSLAEIAEELNISRQGVFDNAKRGKLLLNSYEQKLGLVKKFIEQKNKAKEIYEYTKKINIKNLSDKDKINLEKAMDGIDYLINGLQED